MIPTLVNSALQTGYLSVESEGLIRQVLMLSSCRKDDLDALEILYQGLNDGRIQREAHGTIQLPRLNCRI